MTVIIPVKLELIIIKLGAPRLGHSREIVEQIIPYLQEYTTDFGKGVDTLLEMIYHAYAELNSVETPEFKAIVNPLDQTSRSLVDTDAVSYTHLDVYKRQHLLCCVFWDSQSMAFIIYRTQLFRT